MKNSPLPITLGIGTGKAFREELNLINYLKEAKAQLIKFTLSLNQNLIMISTLLILII